MFGNYIGDGIKGSNLNVYSEPVRRGVRFHRFIDSFTDDHTQVKEAKKLFYPTQAKFSGVVVDVLFDHFLAINWADYSDEVLSDFAMRCYNTVENFDAPMPERSSRFYYYMRRENILHSYQNASDVTRVFRGMDSRTRFESNMSESINDMQGNEQKVENLFHSFFPELIKACQQWKQEN